LIEKDLIFVATVGLRDELKEEVWDVIDGLQDVSTNLRIVSGDHKASAFKTARELGITQREEDVVEGTKLRSDLLQIMKKVPNKDTDNEGGYTYEFNNPDSATYFRNVLRKKVKVVYRASLDDKHMFVAALEKAGVNCAVTGEATNDAGALKEASVGFSMGVGGCAVARENSDIIILNDSFEGVISAVRWVETFLRTAGNSFNFNLQSISLAFSSS